MKWREIGPYLRELGTGPLAPMNWKNPIRVFAVLGWLVVQGFVLLGWAGWRMFQGLKGTRQIAAKYTLRDVKGGV